MRLPAKQRSVLSGAIILSILAVSAALYLPNMGSNFTDWDYGAYKQVLHAHDFQRMAVSLFTDLKGRVVAGYYAPLGSLSLMLDKFLVGAPKPSARITRLVNFLLHILNGLLLLYVLKLLGQDMKVRSVTLLIFLIHPVQVASILWFAQRKTLLGALFCLGSLACFIGYSEKRTWTHYIVALLLFVLALLSKPVYSMFPLVLLATGILMSGGQGRVPSPRSAHAKSPDPDEGRDEETPVLTDRAFWVTSSRFLGPELLRVAPFLAVSAAAAILAMMTEGSKSIVLPLVERPFIASAAIWFYVIKILFPVRLSPIYPMWHPDLSAGIWWVPLLSLAVATFLAYRFRALLGKRVLWGLALFLVPLLPACGLFKFGYQRFSFVADHFLYFSMAGAAYLMALALTRSVGVLAGRLKLAAMAAAAVYFLFLGYQTWAQTRVWTDSKMLWASTVERNPSSVFALNRVASGFLAAKRLGEAESLLQRALKVNPGYPETLNNLGWLARERGRPQEAMQWFEKALVLNPKYAEAHNNMALVLQSLGKRREALEHLRLAVRCKPDVPLLRNNLAYAALALGRNDEAVAQFEKSIQLKPDDEHVLNNLAVIYLNRGEKRKGIALLQRALAVHPGFRPAIRNLERALMDDSLQSRPGSGS